MRRAKLTLCRHACYSVGMNTVQYTIRNVPPVVDRYLRRRAKVSGQSLNAVILQELGDKVGVKSGAAIESLDWFIGSGSVEKAVTQALDADDKLQKELARRQWSQDDN